MKNTLFLFLLVWCSPALFASPAVRLGDKTEIKKEPKTQIETVQIQLSKIPQNLGEYRMLSGQYPTTKQGIQALVDKTKVPPLPRRWAQHFTELPKDAWGRTFEYELVKGRFRIWSLGESEEDPKDDIEYKKLDKGEQAVPPKSDRAGG